MREGSSASRGQARRLLAAAALACALAAPGARAQPAAIPSSGTAVADGPVYAIASAGGRTFIGGDFANVGPRSGAGAQLAGSDGAFRTGLPEIAGGSVNAVVSDGAGGWFVGGSFDTVADQARKRLVHILPDGSLDAWDPAPDGDVLTLAVGESGGARTLYVGGAFNRIRVQPGATTASRAKLAAFDIGAAGSPVGAGTAWNPVVGDGDGNPTKVTSIAVADTSVDVLGAPMSMPLVFVAGRFTEVGSAGTKTKGLVAVWGPGAKSPAGADTGGQLATVLDPAGDIPAPDFRTLALGGRSETSLPGERHQLMTLYVGGAVMDPVGDVVALKVDVASASATAAGSVSDSVYTTSWDPRFDVEPEAIATSVGPSGSSVYVGGSFQSATSFDGTTGEPAVAPLGVAAYKGVADPAGGGERAGQLAGFKYPSVTAVHALAVAGDRLYVGGDFDTIAKSPGRQRLAAVDAATGALVSSWDPRLAGGGVDALAATPAAGYAGGDFTSAHALPRTRLAAIDASGAVIPDWNVPADGPVRALALAGDRLVVGGQFTQIGGAERTSLAAVDAGTGAVSDWAPALETTCTTAGCTPPPLAVLALGLASAGGPVYLGGQFDRVGGADRRNLAAVDLGSGSATAWNPGADGLVYTLLPACGAVFAGGSFSELGGARRARLGAVDAGTGSATAFAPDADSAVFALALGPGVLYAGGQFSVIGGQPRARLAALDPSTGAATGFNPSPDGVVRALAYGDATLFAGGEFDHVGADDRERLAAISPSSGTATGWAPAPDGPVRALSAAGADLTVAGTFSRLTTRMQRGIADFALGTATSDAACPAPPAPAEAPAPPPPPPPPPPAEPVDDEPVVTPSSYTPPPRKPIKKYPPPRDRVAPRFGVRVHGHQIVLGRSFVRLGYIVSEPGRLHLFFERRELVRCPVLVRARHPERHCFSYVRRAAVQRRVRKGAGALKVDGFVRGRPLTPGHYRLTVAATDRTGNYSRAVRIPLLIVR